MKVIFLVVGKTDFDYLKTGIDLYLKRISHYVSISEMVIPALKNNAKLSEALQKEREGELILNNISPSDEVVLLDEKGTTHTSVAFAGFIEKKMIAGVKNLVFVIGGPYGFSPQVYNRANSMLSLSKMTFSHQMVRLIFVEQLYRAMTIIKGEPYHHV